MKKNTTKSESSKLRKNAEDFLTSRPSKPKPRLSEQDMLKLIHELEVHQIELEMQNEELTRAKDLQKEATDKYISLYDFAPSAYFTLSKDGDIVDLNFAGAAILDGDRSSLKNKKIRLFVSDETRPVFDNFIDTVLKSNTKETCEIDFVSKKKTQVCAFISGIAIENGEQCFLMAADITKLKKIERELQAAREKLNIALENGNIGIWEWDLEKDEISLDYRTEQMFGLEKGSFSKSYIAFENLLNEEDIPHVRKAIDSSLKENTPLETIFRTKPENGNTKYISVKALVNKGNNGKPLNFSGVCFDITALREGTEKIVLKLNEDLLRSNKELESFAYVASHDLQEPLRMVSSFTQLLAQRYSNKLDKDANEFIQYAVDGAKRMQALLEGLLAYSRIQTRGKEFSKVKMKQVVDIALLNLKQLIDEKNIHIEVKELPEIIADGGQMLQLMQNLIGNALKFSNNNTSIVIYSNSNADENIISVKDEGMGIEAQYFERIFQIFQRLVPKDEYEGTGMGLAICKRIVERHNGKIWLESQPGKGSVFYFKIPKVQLKF